METLIEQARVQIAQAFEDGEAGLAQSREALSAFRQQAASVTDAAVEEMNQRLRVGAEETQSGWHARLHADLTAATELWDQRIDSSLESAAQKSAERLARNSQAAAERLENELGSRISSLGKVFAEATAEAESRLNALRTAVQGEAARAQARWRRCNPPRSASMSTPRNSTPSAQRAAGTSAPRRHRPRSAEPRAGAPRRKRPRPASDRKAAAFSGSRCAAGRRAPGSANRPGTGRRASSRPARPTLASSAAWPRWTRPCATSRKPWRSSSDQSVETARGRLQETIDRLSRELEETGRASSEKWLAEIDTKATETTHATFESLFKTADWYEKKVQMQMQSALEKGLEQAAVGLREKAGEISRLFASELDHYNRSYVEHAHSQLEEAAREVFDHARRQSAELVAESVASLAQQAEAQAQAVLASVHAQAGVALGQISAQVSAQLAQARTDIAEEGRRYSEEFREALASERQDALTAARHDLTLLTASSVAELRNEGRAQQAQLAQALAASSEQAISEYRKRLEAASSSWLLTTVSRLDQQSQQLIQSIAQSAQTQLREACVQVFAEVGENLRQRMLDLARAARGQRCRGLFNVGRPCGFDVAVATGYHAVATGNTVRSAHPNRRVRAGSNE